MSYHIDNTKNWNALFLCQTQRRKTVRRLSGL